MSSASSSSQKKNKGENQESDFKSKSDFDLNSGSVLHPSPDSSLDSDSDSDSNSASDSESNSGFSVNPQQGWSPKTIESLCEKVKQDQPQSNVAFLQKAYNFAEKAHRGQKRLSGKDYIIHPLEVAFILADLSLDMATITTALLHDTVEDTKVSLKDIEKEFGSAIAQLVDGVTKLSHIKFSNVHQRQTESMRKVLVSMGKDVRVILVKLADRLHNMRTLEHLPPNKQEWIALETLEIYSPIASRLGINAWKLELEDLAFRYCRPHVYQTLLEKVNKTKEKQEDYIHQFKKLLEEHLHKANCKAEVDGRLKNLWSVYCKMERQNLNYEQIYDILAFRILTDSVFTCYEILGIVHSLWKPIPGRFKDFIAMPKTNNYQSLHTTVLGPSGQVVEIQIRTKKMHAVAQRGIAAHWKYKKDFDPNVEKTLLQFDWLQEVLFWNQKSPSSNEFLENVKSDLFESEIHALTPKGEVKALPEGATPIDFAYAIHTEVGNNCVGAKVNGKLVSLRYKIKNGDMVDILSSKSQKPSKDWLKFCITNKARSSIRSFVRQEQHRQAVQLGRELLERELREYRFNFQALLKSEKLFQYLKEKSIPNVDELCAQVSYGRIQPEDIIHALINEKDLKKNPQRDAEVHKKADADKEAEGKSKMGFLSSIVQSAFKKHEKSSSLVQIRGIKDVLVHFAKCCHPIPGDSIVALITRDRGVTVHRANCPRTFEWDASRHLEATWNTKSMEKGLERKVRLRVSSHDIPGLLKTISGIFEGQDVNILSANVWTTKDKKALCLFDIGVRDTVQLNQIIQSIQAIPDIISVNRVIHKL